MVTSGPELWQLPSPVSLWVVLLSAGCPRPEPAKPLKGMEDLSDGCTIDTSAPQDSSAIPASEGFYQLSPLMGWSSFPLPISAKFLPQGQFHFLESRENEKEHRFGSNSTQPGVCVCEVKREKAPGHPGVWDSEGRAYGTLRCVPRLRTENPMIFGEKVGVTELMIQEERKDSSSRTK